MQNDEFPPFKATILGSQTFDFYDLHCLIIQRLLQTVNLLFQNRSPG